MKNEIRKEYQVILICSESVKNSTSDIYKNKFLSTMITYDPKAHIDNFNIVENVHGAYKIQGKQIFNIVTIDISLVHNDNLGSVLKNITRKYQNTIDTYRICILQNKNKITELNDINGFRKSVEAAIY